MNTPNPALVTQRAVQALPRLALWLLCAAYVLPGIFGRDPWKNADVMAVGYMMSLHQGDAGWLHPMLAGVGSTGSLLPYWIGAGAMQLFGGWLDLTVAARLPFALMLAGTLALVWYATLNLARTEAAQPLAFAFGGEASPIDYSRAIADGSVLALISALGLLQLGHETTPELTQLLSTTLYLYGLAAGPYRPGRSRLALLLALPALAASGAATTALLLALAGLWICLASHDAAMRRLAGWIVASGAGSALIAWALDAWVWRVAAAVDPAGVLRVLAWFTWPVWPMALWTLWQWRRQVLRRHVAAPLAVAGVAVAVSVAMGGSDRALMLALPALSVLAAFALPTLRRSVSAAIDWFSVFFFSACAIAIWVIYAAMQTGVPPKIAANVARLAPGFEPSGHPVQMLLALAATLAWLWLVRWRTGRHRHALWKSLVLPAGGVALCWLLLMTLWLPLLDYARSYRPMMQRLATVVPPKACLLHRGLSLPQVAAILVHSQHRVEVLPADARLDRAAPDIDRAPEAVDPPDDEEPSDTALDPTACNWLLVSWDDRTRPGAAAPALPGWRYVDKVRRPTDRNEAILVYRRRAR
ncbi:ArnT family glycosyltransferase [Leptothrix sp. BB-4]